MRSNVTLLVNRGLFSAQSTRHTDWATDKNWHYQKWFLASHQNNLLFDIKEKKLFGQTFNKHSFYYHIFLPIYHCMARAVWKFSLFNVEMNMKYFALFSVSGLVLFFFLVFWLFSAICAWNFFACLEWRQPTIVKKMPLKK